MLNAAIQALYQIADTLSEDEGRIYEVLNDARDHSENDPSQSLKLAEHAKTLAESINFLPGIAWSLRESGSTHHHLGEHDLALEQLNNSVKMFETLGILAGVASSTNVIGHIESERSNFAAAIGCYERYVSIARELDRLESEGVGLGNIAEVLGEIGDHWQALEYHFKALELAREVKHFSPTHEPWVLTNIGLTYQELGQSEQALEYYQQALALQLGLNDKRFAATTLCAIARGYDALARDREAIEALAQALELTSQTADRLTEMQVLTQSAEVRLRRGETELANLQARKALEIAQLLQDRRSKIVIYNLIARSSSGTNLQSVLEWLEHSLKLAQELELKSLELETWLAFSEVYERFSEASLALGAFKRVRALEAIEQIEDNRRRIKNVNAKLELERSKAQVRHVQDQAQNERTLRQEFERLAMLDPLTGIQNRRSLEAELLREIARTERSGQEFCLAMIDIDHFKQINDTYGHPFGDTVIRQLVQIMLEGARAMDVLARYGGEEFILLLPDTNLQDAVVVCERTRLAVEHYDWKKLGQDLQVTVSVGIGGSLEVKTIEALLSLADSRLYAAKQNGRNLVNSRLRQERAAVN
jgi:diguanylate cyclase (GGDEF)-like protein